MIRVGDCMFPPPGRTQFRADSSAPRPFTQLSHYLPLVHATQFLLYTLALFAAENYVRIAGHLWSVFVLQLLCFDVGGVTGITSLNLSLSLQEVIAGLVGFQLLFILFLSFLAFKLKSILDFHIQSSPPLTQLSIHLPHVLASNLILHLLAFLAAKHHVWIGRPLGGILVF